MCIAVCLVAAGCVSSISTEGVKQYTNIMMVFLVVTNVAIAVILPLVAPVHQSAQFVFGHFDVEDARENGLPNLACAPLALSKIFLPPLFCFLDSSVHSLSGCSEGKSLMIHPEVAEQMHVRACISVLNKNI